MVAGSWHVPVSVSVVSRDTYIEVKVGSASQRTVGVAPDMGGFVWNEALAFEVRVVLLPAAECPL